MENADRYEEDELAVCEKLAVQTQNVFRWVTGRAEWKVMKVNTSKTKMLCISDAMSHIPGTYIESSLGGKDRQWGPQRFNEVTWLPSFKSPRGSCPCGCDKKEVSAALFGCLLYTSPSPRD